MGEAVAHMQPPGEGRECGSDGVGGKAVVHKKGVWSTEEDEKLIKAVEEYGVRNWVSIEKFSGLARPAKNCRLRWLNYLRPNLKKHPFTSEEEALILQLHFSYGNSWSRIAGKLPGRSDNDIKNFWHKRAKKRQKHHLPIYPQNIKGQANVDEANAADKTDRKCFPSNNITTKYSSYATRISAPKFQPKMDMVPASIHLPQILISAPQPQLDLSPSTVTSSWGQSPSSRSVDQTPRLPHGSTTPTQNLLASPIQTTQTSETPLWIRNTVAVHTHTYPPSWQGNAPSNAITPLREPSILSPPQHCLKQFCRTDDQLISPVGHSMRGLTFMPSPGSSLPSQGSSAMELPGSPQKFTIQSRVPRVYPSMQMSTQSTDAPFASLSGIKQKLPTPPVSPFKLQLPAPVPSESFSQSNVLISNSTIQLNSSTASVPSTLVQLEQSSSSQDFTAVQPMDVDPNYDIPMDSSPSVGSMLSSVQLNPAATPGEDHSALELESDKKLMNELIEAEERVKFLKKRLKMRRLTESAAKENTSTRSVEEVNEYCREIRKKPMDKYVHQSTTKEYLSCTSSRTNNATGDMLRVNAPLNSTRKDMQDKAIGKSGTDHSQGMQKLQKRDDPEVGEHMKESRESEQVRGSESSSTKTLQEGGFLMKFSTTGQEQMHLIDLFDHINSQKSMTNPNSYCWDAKQRPYQFPVNQCSAEEHTKACSTIGCLFSRCSILLQDSLLEGDMFGQRSGVEYPWTSKRDGLLVGTFGPVYSQSIATTLQKTGNVSDQITYFQLDRRDFADTLGPEFSDVTQGKQAESSSMNGNLLETLMPCEPKLLQQQYSIANLQESSIPVSKPIAWHKSLVTEELYVQTSQGENSAQPQKLCESSLLVSEYPEARQLDSGYLGSEQLMERKSPGGKQVSLQTSNRGKLAEASQLSNSTLSPHRHSMTNQVDSQYLVTGTEHGYRTCEQHSKKTLAVGEFYEENWNQESSQEQGLDRLFTENLWPETQLVSHNQTLLTNTSEPAVNQISITQSMESTDSNKNSGHGNAGDNWKQENKHNHTIMIPEELSGLLEFYPTTMQTIDWSNNCTAFPGIKAYNELDMIGQGTLHISSSSQPPPITIADYL